MTIAAGGSGQGGGTSAGLGQTFQQHPFTGTHSTSLPIFTSPCRKAAPHLALNYSSGAGNGVFGLGFDLGLGHVQRKHQRRRPSYDEHDVFVIEGADDLVPQLHKIGEDWVPVQNAHATEDGVTYEISYYHARTEGEFARVEKWAASAQDFHWRVRTLDNHVSIYGKDSDARVCSPMRDDPAIPPQTFSWLLQEQRDPKGERTVYSYVRDDPDAQGGNLYIAQIKYGPYRDSAGRQQFHFAVHFDYSDRSLADQDPQVLSHPRAAPRLDPSLSYVAGFAVATRVLCRRILMTHRYGDADPFVVRATHLNFDETAVASKLVSCSGYGYGADGLAKATPTIEYGYTEVGKSSGFTKLRDADGRALRMPISAFADIYGDGIPAVLHQTGPEVFVSRALGKGTYAAPTLMAHQPLGSGVNSAFTLQDLDRTGRLDLVQTSGGTSGYFELGPKGVWQPFVAFESSLTDGELVSAHKVDMTGDGRADMVRVEAGKVYVHPSLGRRGFGAGVAPQQSRRDGAPPLPLVGRPSEQELVTFANILGHGLSHLVRITSEGISYWPNLGYGQFGDKQRLSLPDGITRPINPKYLQFGDVDGTGAADLIQFGHGDMKVFANLSGNGFAAAVRMPLPFALGDLDAIRFAGITGSGAACAVLSDMSGPMITHWVFDFMQGQKPHLLNLVKSSMGLEHRAEYASSVVFSLKDRADGRAWRTQLSTPVSVVRSTEVIDLVGGTVSRSDYHYHDGYYDRAEKEFRGFGCVETTHGLGSPIKDDPEIYWAHPDAADLAQSAQSMTREWFFTGDVPPADGYAHFYRPGADASPHHFDFYAPPEQHYTLGPNVPAGANGTRDNAADHRQECWRALHGKRLRSEVYDLADVQAATPLKPAKPLQATEENYTFFCHQPAHLGAAAVISAAKRESVGYYYEGETSAPMISHSINMAYDSHDVATHIAKVNYGKREACEAGQEATVITGHIAEAFAFRSDVDLYLGRLIHQTRSYDLAPDTVVDGELVAVSDLLNALTRAAKGPPRTWNRRFYITADGGECRADGKDIAPQAILFRTEDTVLPEGLSTDMAARFTPALLKNDAKLTLKDGFWWAPSTRMTVLMTRHAFYQVASRSDAMGAVTTLSYSADYLNVRRRTEPSGFWHAFTYDPYCRSVSSVTDANGVTVQTLYDALGQTRATTSFGQQGRQPAGDLAILGEVPVAPDSLADVIGDPARYLGPASTATLYDHDAYAHHKSPNWRVKLSRLQGLQDVLRRGEGLAAISIELAYLDGLGRTFQTKTLTEAGQAVLRDGAGALILEGRVPKHGHCDTRWRVDGFVVRDTNNRPVLTYQPYFSATFEVETEAELATFGHPSRLEYDAMHRVTRTHTPAKFITRIETSAWHIAHWDAVDTILESPAYIDKDTAGTDPLVVDAMIDAAKLSGTPHMKFFDASKRIVALKQQITKGVFQTIRHGYDSADHLLWTKVDHPLKADAPDAEADAGSDIKPAATVILEQKFDMRGRMIWSRSAARGETWHLYAADGENIAVWNDKDQCLLSTYDDARRPMDIVLVTRDRAKGTAALRTLSKVSYHAIGDSPNGKNTYGKTSEICDEAGIVRMDAYTIEGAPTHVVRTFLADPFTAVDWETPPELDPQSYLTVQDYNARGDVISITYPDGATANMTYAQDGQLLSQAVIAQDGVARCVTSGAQYSAKGQLSCVQLGTSVRAEYIHDDATGFARQFRAIQAGDTGDVTLQDLHYVHDPMGHTYAMTVQGHASGPSPSTAIYRYDGLYQLTQSKTSVGAQLIAQEDFSYDLMGNLLSLSLEAGDRSTRIAHGFEDGSNRLLSVTPENGTAQKPGYDPLGNMVSDGAGTAFEWDAHGRLCKITPHGGAATIVQYDMGGTKVRQVQRGGADRRYLGDMRIEAGDGGVCTTRLDFHDEHAHRAVLETVTHGDDAPQVTLSLNVTDSLGSVQMTVADSGETQRREAYRAYGASDENEGKDAKHRYSGKEYLAAGGIYDFGARFYAPTLGQWISPDPIGHGDGANMYRFVGGNPVSFNDKSGFSRNQVAPAPEAPVTTMRQPPPEAAWSQTALPPTERHQRLHRTAVHHQGEDRSGFSTYSQTKINKMGLRTGLFAKLTRVRLKMPFVRLSTRAAFEVIQAGAEAARSDMTDEQKSDLNKATAVQILKTPVAWAADAVAGGTMGASKVVTTIVDHLADGFSGGKRIKVGTEMTDPANRDVTRGVGLTHIAHGEVTKGDHGEGLDGGLRGHIPLVGNAIAHAVTGGSSKTEAANAAVQWTLMNGDGFKGGHMTTPIAEDHHLPGQVSPLGSRRPSIKSPKQQD